MKLKVVTPEKVVVDADVDAVTATATDGSLGVLPKHQPMVSALDIGLLTYTASGAKHKLAVMGGLLKTDGKEVVVLSDSAEQGEDIDAARAQQAKDRAEARLKAREAGTDVQRAEMALKRAMTRMKAVK